MKSGHVTWSLSFFLTVFLPWVQAAQFLTLSCKCDSCDMVIISRLFNPKEKKKTSWTSKIHFYWPGSRGPDQRVRPGSATKPTTSRAQRGKSNLHSRYLLLNLLRPYVGRRIWALGFCWDHCCGLHQRSGLWLTLGLLSGWLQVGFFCSRRVYTSKIIKGYS